VISFDEARKPRVPLHEVMNAANNHVKGVLEDIYKGLSRFDQDTDKEANKGEESKEGSDPEPFAAGAKAAPVPGVIINSVLIIERVVNHIIY
jgi:hypothetical protein